MMPPRSMTELKGIFSDLCTPFTEAEELDLESLDRLVEYAIASGVHGIALCGSVSELPLLTTEERKTITERAILKVNGRVPVVVGVSHEAWFHACKLLMHAASLHASGFMVLPPRAGAPSEERIRRFFRDLAECAEGLPVILQNSPGFTGVTLSTELLLRLTPEELAVRTTELLETMRGRPGYIFNLGHGVPPATPLENIASVVRTVREFSNDGSLRFS